MTLQEMKEMTLQEIKDAIAKLQEQIAKMEEPKSTFKRWRNANDDDYYYIGDYGHIENCEESLDGVDDHRYNIGNYFETEEQAEAYRDKLIKVQAIKDRIAELNGRWEPEFKGDNPNYALRIHNDGSLLTTDFYLSQYLPKWAYFKSREIGEQLMKEFGGDLYLLFE
jgi:hypothetical protein